MTELAYEPSPAADQALRTIAQLAYNMPDGDSPAACCPLVEQLGVDSIVQELLDNRMVREFHPISENETDGKRVGMTDVGLRYIDAKLESGEYIVEDDGFDDPGWNNFSVAQI